MKPAPSVPNPDHWFPDAHGLPQPHWGDIHGWMRAFGCMDDETAWQQVCHAWLERLRAALGGGYAVTESAHFMLVAEASTEESVNLLKFAEHCRSEILELLPDPSAKRPGKHVVIRFSETDDYYAYIAPYFPEGEFATSGGVFLPWGYSHIAYPTPLGMENRQTVAHELTHNLLVHLPLPAWINEALAMFFEQHLANGQWAPLDRELVLRHREHWTDITIQDFWQGSSFFQVEAQELSYCLARTLFSLIQGTVQPSPEDFRRFVLRADRMDAGAIAAREHLGCELSELVGTFLGPGEWRPRPDEWIRKASEAE